MIALSARSGYQLPPPARSFWDPVLFLEAGIRPGEMGQFTPRELRGVWRAINERRDAQHG